MTFVPKSWGNFASGGTPLNAAALVDLETRLSNYTDTASGSLGLFNVQSYGAVGNGVANDTTPIANAVAAADLVNGVVWFPPGTYLSDVNVPDGVSLWGSGSYSTWIKGVLTSIGSHTQYRDLKIGNTGVRGTFSANATDVLFENCWLFGGNNEALIYMNDNSITNVRFVDCELSGNTSTGNGVQIVDKGTVAKHIEDVTFTRCWFHGNDRMNFECIQRDDGVSFPVVTGYRNVSLYNCVLDIAAGASGNQINVSYDGGPVTGGSVRSSGYSVVRGCKVTGGVYGVELAGPTDMLIEGNRVSAQTSDSLSMSQYGTAATERHIARIVGNTFVAPANVVLMGQGVTFVGNDVQAVGSLRLNVCSYSTVTGNTIETTGGCAVSLEHSANNVITANQVRGGSGQSFLFIYTDTTDNIVDGNWIDAPGIEFDIRDGTLQRFGRNVLLSGGTVYEEGRELAYNPLTYSTSITPQANKAKIQQIAATDGVAFAINAATLPVFGYEMTIEIQNATGGALGVITWNAIYHMAGAFTNPATGKKRSVTFYYDRGTSTWVEKSRTAADI